MATYLIVNCLFLVAALVIFRVRLKRPARADYLTLMALLILTAVFDSIIVGFGIVGYDQSQILGIYIGNAPIEDFFYALLAVMMVPALWNRLGKRHAKDS